MNFFNLVMISKMKMYITTKIFGYICLKAVRDTFCPMFGLRSRDEHDETWRKGGRLNFLVRVTFNNKRRF